jgi:single-stranded-DNA-specific exonuclease
MLRKFGGHAMAAGLTLAADQFEQFRQAFAETVALLAPADIFTSVIDTDGLLEESELTLKNAELLAHAFPWGQGFPAPRFDGEFEVLDQRVVGERHLKLTLGLPGCRGVIDAIHFNAPVADWPRNCQRVSGIYQLGVNDYRGQRSPQLLFEYLVPVISRDRG